MFISEIDQIVATQDLQQTWDRIKLLQQEVASNLSGSEPDSSKTSNADDDLDHWFSTGGARWSFKFLYGHAQFILC